MLDWRHGRPVAVLCLFVLVLSGLRLFAVAREPAASTTAALQQTFGRSTPPPIKKGNRNKPRKGQKARAAAADTAPPATQGDPPA